MNKINWIVIAAAGGIALLILAFCMVLLASSGLGGWGYGGWTMMGPGMMGGMFFMWLIPVGFVVLTVLGIVWLVQSANTSTPARVAYACPSCGQAVQTGWKNCPFCGSALSDQ